MVTINEQFIKRLALDGKRTIYADDKLPGFALRVNESGKLTFLFRYRYCGHQKTFTVGSTKVLTAAQAREEARKLAGDVARGFDPNERKRKARGIPLFKEIAADYLNTTHKRSLRDDKAKLERVLLKRWGSRPIDKIGAADVRQLMKSLVDKGLANATVNRYRSLVSALFSRAIESGYIVVNPVAGVKRLQENNVRDRWLDEKELDDFLKELSNEPENAANCILMMLYTGARRGNVLNMRWQDVSPTRKAWTIPQTKSGKSQFVPLNDLAISLLEKQRAMMELNNPYVFPGNKQGKPLSTVQQAWERAIRRAGIVNIRIHDLRHTFASHAAMKGVDLYTVSKLLGHHSPVMTARYAHLRDKSLMEATDAVVISLNERRRVAA